MSQHSPIAIVGMSGILPGAADLDQFWDNVIQRVDAARPVPPGRWILDAADVYQPLQSSAGASDHVPFDSVYSTRACFVDPFTLDYSGLALPRELIDRLDPLYHMVLRAGREAFASAKLDACDRDRIGVSLASIALPIDGASQWTREILGGAFEEKVRRSMQRASAKATAADASTLPSPFNLRATGMPAGLLAQALGIGGGAYTLDAACASSLYAIRFACDELHARRSDVMLAGGVSRPESLYTQMGFCQLRALSRRGQCRPFDAQGDGLLVGEGAGVFVLKRLDDALRDGDRVLALIHDVGLSNDIGGSLLAPDSEGQLRAMRGVYERAGWSPSDVDLIECHGTGTPVGDGVEVASLRSLWEGCDWSAEQCAIGSVKSNVGHLLTGAGAAGLLKTLLAFQHHTLPPSANFEKPADAVPLPGSPFRVQTAAEPWRARSDGSRKAAVSAFGFGGINAHMLLSEFQDAPARGRSSVAVPPPQKTYVYPESDALAADGSGDRDEAPAVAVVGMASRVGPLKSLRELQQRWFRGDSALSRRPADRWSGCDDRLRELLPDTARQMGCWIDRIEIESGRFRIPPAEMPEILPQQLLMLAVAADCLDDAGMPLRERRPAMGALIGHGLDANTTNFHQRWCVLPQSREWTDGASLDSDQSSRWVAQLRDAAGPPLNATRTVGALGGIIASRIAREFKFGGPSFALSSEESSGLTALELGIRALQRGEMDAVLVGAVDLPGDPRMIAADRSLRQISPTARLRPMDESADGTLPGEGAGAVILKRLDDAVRDGDRIYCVVRGVGRASGAHRDDVAELTRVYSLAMQRALNEADAKADSLTLIEMHGSGDPREDTAEAAALAKSMAHPHRAAALSCAAPVVGHVGAASGIISLIKAALATYQQVLPPLPGYRRPRAELAAAADRLHVLPQASYWHRDRADGPRRAAVASIGLDGSCAHVILEEHAPSAVATTIEREQPLGPVERALFITRAVGGSALTAALNELRDFATAPGHKSFHVERLARMWHRRTSATAARHGDDIRAVALLAVDRSELVRLIDDAARSIAAAPSKRLSGRGNIWYSPEPFGADAMTAVLFPGSGNHLAGMGTALSAAWPQVLRQLDHDTQRLADHLRPAVFAPHRLDWSDGWETDAAARMRATPIDAIFGQVSYGVVMTDLLQLFGFKPSAFIGYSLGESAAMFASRAWRGRDEMFDRLHASPLFREDLFGSHRALRQTWKSAPHDPLDWTAAVVARPERDVKQAIEGISRAYLLIVNTPRECVIGGSRDAVNEVAMRLKCRPIPLEAVPAVHCEAARPVEAAYRELHLLHTTPPAGARIYSCAWARAYEINTERAAASITEQAMRGFDYPQLIRQAYRDGVRIFVEAGPQASCVRMVERILEDKPFVACSASVRGMAETESVLRVLAQLAVEGVPIDLGALYGRETRVVEHREQIEPARPPIVVPVALQPGEIPIPPFEVVPASVDSGAVTTIDQTAGHTVDHSGLRAARHLVNEYSAHSRQPSFSETAASQVAAAAPTSFESHQQNNAVFPHSVTPAPAAFSPVDMSLMQSSTPHDRPYEFPRDASAMEPIHGDIESQFVANVTATQSAHGAFLEFSHGATQGFASALAIQSQIADAINNGGSIGDAVLTAHWPPITATATVPDVALSREQCMEFAIGSIAAVLGPEFAEVDTYPTRVRLPDEPLMLVDRIMSIHGEKCSMSGGSVVTEHDVHHGAWYLDGNRAPVCITVEAGQADLFLCSWLGIDLQTRGKRMYRLLDAVVNFHRGLPQPGETIRYDIHIDKFVRQGDTWLFFFRFDGTINGQPMLTMREGCAGFFTYKEIEDSGGIVLTSQDTLPREGRVIGDYRPLITAGPCALSDERIEALRSGDLAGCFGPQFAALPLRDPVRIPDGRMKLLDRVLELDPRGGRFGLGIVRAEADVQPNDWYLTCHFSDDMVMPGTLMYECCAHTLRVLLMRMGWVAEETETCWEPMLGVPARLKCRGPVTASTKKIVYEVVIKEIGYGPEPYVIADALMYADGRRIVQFVDMSLRMTGMSRSRLESIWSSGAMSSATSGTATTSSVDPATPVPSATTIAPIGGVAIPVGVKPAIYDTDRIRAFAIGRPSDAFGPPYEIFDDQRRIARLPGPPYQFLDRVTEIHDCAPFRLASGGWIESQYDVPADAWYFRANRQPQMPFSVLLEIALQPCGWLAAYLGSALRSDKDLSFRNLGGTATQYEPIHADAGTLTMRTRITSVSEAGGMILQNYLMQVWRQGRCIYNGSTAFGFFSAAALANQVGIRDAGDRIYLPTDEERDRHQPLLLDDLPPRTPDDEQQIPAAGLAMPARAYRMIDELELFVPDGGPHGLGYAVAVAHVDPEAWFFKAHFFQDPVWPGSLGLESFLQVMKLMALERWGRESGQTHRFDAIATNREHTWLYRGQIIPRNKRVTVEVCVTQVIEGPIPGMTASGFLKVDGRSIYEMIDFSLRLVPRE